MGPPLLLLSKINAVFWLSSLWSSLRVCLIAKASSTVGGQGDSLSHAQSSAGLSLTPSNLFQSDPARERKSANSWLSNPLLFHCLCLVHLCLLLQAGFPCAPWLTQVFHNDWMDQHFLLDAFQKRDHQAIAACTPGQISLFKSFISLFIELIKVPASWLFLTSNIFLAALQIHWLWRCCIHLRCNWMLFLWSSCFQWFSSCDCHVLCSICPHPLQIHPLPLFH